MMQGRPTVYGQLARIIASPFDGGYANLTALKRVKLIVVTLGVQSTLFERGRVNQASKH